MAVNRVLYATQTVRLGLGATPTWYTLPAQSANADETIPQDDVLVLGKLGGVARLQKDVATCKASTKIYLCDAITIHDVTEFPGNANLGDMSNMVAIMQSLESDSIAGRNNTLNVDSQGQGSANKDGFSMEGVCSSIGIDASKGAFPMIDISWEGVGRLERLDMGTSSTLTQSTGGDWYVKTAEPLTSQKVTITNVANDTIANVKISYDMPVETLSRLGGTILGKSSEVKTHNQMFSKPPFKATMTADGQSAADVATQWGTTCAVKFDATTNSDLTCTIQAAGLNVSTKSFSQSVGDVGATFSVTAEGTKMLFS